MSSSNQSILLVDDDPLLVMSLERILKKKGYRVIKTANSEQVIELMASEHVDLVVLDFYLAGVNGSEILETMRRNGSFANIPVIMLTSEESPDIIEKCLDSGATDFIIKPIIPKVLLARIRSALAHRENILQIETQREEISKSRQQLSEALSHLEKDIKKARITQTTLIPASYIESEHYRMYSYYKPMIEVGGDFFSYFESAGKTDILFGDVSGHGISSAMVSCMAVLCFQTMPHDKDEIDQELAYLHKTLSGYVVGHYITGVYLRFDARTFTLQYAYAAHHNIILIRNQNLIVLEGKGTPLILLDDFITNSYSVPLEKGDRLFLFSDGLFEIFNPENEFYGIEKFYDNIQNKINLKGKEFLNAVSDFAMEFSHHIIKDDMTMLLIEF
ncbi:MAG: fused response regulator/phosphatase [Leptospiraceae bacterium]|nr:fused response regulator/phosphatase [Leptospiraceae bacterium]